MRTNLEQRPSQRKLQGQRFANMQLQLQMTKADLVDVLSEEKVPEPETAEPTELEDYGDSEVFLQGLDAESPFDRELLLSLPLISQLPWRARPIVRYRLDQNLDLHGIAGKGRHADLRDIVAFAIGEHLRRCEVPLKQLGDWCHLPAIDGARGLLGLVIDIEDRRRLSLTLAKVGSELKNFAILLPSGDVITPEALLLAAGEGKRATRAAALRLRKLQPEVIAGETWTSEDWHKFDATQRKKGGERKRPRT